MSRGLIMFLLLALLVGGALFFLSGQAAEEPVTTIEEDVSLEADAE